MCSRVHEPGLRPVRHDTVIVVAFVEISNSTVVPSGFRIVEK
jgi:hypothetical protein